jgi:hypothetical protein
MPTSDTPSIRLDRRPARLWTVRAGAFVAAASLACGLAGCDRDNAAQRAIEDASIKLGALGTSGSTPLPSIDSRKSQFQSIVTSLRAVASETSGGQASAANLMMARASAGLGDIAAAEATEAESEALRTAASVLAPLDQALSQIGVAKGLEIFDPTEEIAAIDGQIAEKRTELAGVQERLAGQRAVVSDLEAKASSARASARGEQEQEAQARLAAQQGSQTMRLSALEQANQYRRRADSAERQAAEFDAEAALERPKAEAIQLDVTRLTRQIELLEERQVALRERATTSKAQADRARADAADAVRQVRERLDQLAKLREATGGPTEEALRQYSSAAGSARKAAQGASRDAANNARLSASSALISAAGIKAGRTRGLQVFADVLKSVDGAGLEGVGDVRSKIAAAEEAAKASAEETRTAYEEAVSALPSGGSGDVATRVESMKARLEALIGKKPEPAGEPGAESPGEPSADAPAPDAPAPGDQPEGGETPDAPTPPG